MEINSKFSVEYPLVYPFYLLFVSLGICILPFNIGTILFLIKFNGNKMKKTILASCLFLSLGSVHAVESPRWDSVSLSYESADFGGNTFTGGGISGSKSVGEHFFVAGSYVSVSGETSNFIRVDLGGESRFLETKVDAVLNTLSAGIGFHQEVAKNSDFFVLVSYLDVEADIKKVAKNSDNGYGAQVGLRSLISPNIELSGSLVYSDIGESSETGVHISGSYHITELFSLGIGYSKSDDTDVLSASATFSF